MANKARQPAEQHFRCINCGQPKTNIELTEIKDSKTGQHYAICVKDCVKHSKANAERPYYVG